MIKVHGDGNGDDDCCWCCSNSGCSDCDCGADADADGGISYNEESASSKDASNLGGTYRSSLLLSLLRW